MEDRVGYQPIQEALKAAGFLPEGLGSDLPRAKAKARAKSSTSEKKVHKHAEVINDHNHTWRRVDPYCVRLKQRPMRGRWWRGVCEEGRGFDDKYRIPTLRLHDAAAMTTSSYKYKFWLLLVILIAKLRSTGWRRQ